MARPGQLGPLSSPAPDPDVSRAARNAAVRLPGSTFGKAAAWSGLVASVVGFGLYVPRISADTKFLQASYSVAAFDGVVWGGPRTGALRAIGAS